MATWLEREFARIDRVTPPDPGRVTARRLNRNEYNNTIHDLLGVELRPADDFPQDDAGYGFDNIADVLSLSPVLMEKYLSAADNVARVALFGPPTLKPTLTRLRSEGRRNGEARTFRREYDVTGLSMPNAFHAVHRVPVEGEYMLKVFLGGAAARRIRIRSRCRCGSTTRKSRPSSTTRKSSAASISIARTSADRPRSSAPAHRR